LIWRCGLDVGLSTHCMRLPASKAFVCGTQCDHGRRHAAERDWGCAEKAIPSCCLSLLIGLSRRAA
jgi:hypothetical protein